MKNKRLSVLFCVAILICCLGTGTALGSDEFVTDFPARGISRRIAPKGQRPLIVVPPFETVKLSDAAVRDYNSYVLRISLYEKDVEGRWTLSAKRVGAFAQQSSQPGAVNWASLGFDDYVKARPGLADYDKLSISETAYVTMRDAECNVMTDPDAKEQCLAFRKHRRTEWLDGLLQKDDNGKVVTETVAPLTGGSHPVAAAPLEETGRPGVKHPELAFNPCEPGTGGPSGP